MLPIFLYKIIFTLVRIIVIFFLLKFSYDYIIDYFNKEKFSSKEEQKLFSKMPDELKKLYLNLSDDNKEKIIKKSTESRFKFIDY